jgi:hypothetical protein
MVDRFNLPDGSTRGIRLGLAQSPTGDPSSASAAKELRKSLNNYSLLLAPGILGGLFGYVVYPPLDQAPLVTFGLGVLFLPMLLHLWSTMRKSPADDASMLRKAYICSSLVLAIFAGFLVLNGRLDKSPRTLVRTTVVQKSLSRGRGAAAYTLTVSSWRPGRRSEDFRVSSRAFASAVIGEPVTIELHKGYFGVPWSGNIFLH